MIFNWKIPKSTTRRLGILFLNKYSDAFMLHLTGMPNETFITTSKSYQAKSTLPSYPNSYLLQSFDFGFFVQCYLHLSECSTRWQAKSLRDFLTLLDTTLRITPSPTIQSLEYTIVIFQLTGKTFLDWSKKKNPSNSGLRD